MKRTKPLRSKKGFKKPSMKKDSGGGSKGLSRSLGKGFKKGPRTLEWEAIRAKLKTAFAKVGITRCEVCGIDNYLGFAHRYKRAECSFEELHIVALLCNKDHDIFETMSHEAMFEAIDQIIKRRVRQPIVEP